MVSFGLCNVPANFPQCLTSILSDMLEDIIEAFSDDFFVVGDTFDGCLDYLAELFK